MAQGSPHSCLLIAKWQWELWSRQIANLYDQIRCAAVNDFPVASVSNVDLSKTFGGLLCEKLASLCQVSVGWVQWPVSGRHFTKTVVGNGH